jgi:hypothetical protein
VTLTDTKFQFAESLVIGVTGTHTGATVAQKTTLRAFIQFLQPDEARHGDCIGVDAEFHDIVRESLETSYIVVHPPTDPKRRAYKQGDLIKPPKPFLVRDDDVILASDLMFGVPGEFKEHLRSGTWATIRHTRKFKKPLVIIYPDGTIEPERLLPFFEKCGKIAFSRQVLNN